MIFRLTEEIRFPDPRLIPDERRDADDVYAVGGNYSPMRLYEASRMGVFPWSAYYDELKLWYCPMRRFVIFPNEIHISHSMKQLLKKGRYRTSIDEAFDWVVMNCGVSRMHEEGAWLGEELMNSVCRLHRMGLAHSVEVWDGDELVGGLYGEFSDGVFFGESMFSRIASGSKIALIHLAKYMQEKGYKLIDCQIETEHLKSMGGRYISYEEYMRIKGYDKDIQPYEFDSITGKEIEMIEYDGKMVSEEEVRKIIGIYR